MTITIAPATRDDIDGLVGLTAELIAFFGSTAVPPIDVLEDRVRTNLFDDNLGTHVLVARDDTTVIGMANYAFVWPARAGTRSIYLKELYVLEAHRRKGVGLQLMEAVKEVGLRHECSRIDWTVDNSNPDAFGFYERIESFESDKVGYRLSLE